VSEPDDFIRSLLREFQLLDFLIRGRESTGTTARDISERPSRLAMNLALASNGLVTIKATGLPSFSRSPPHAAVLAELVPVKPRRTIMPSLYSRFLWILHP